MTMRAFPLAFAVVSAAVFTGAAQPPVPAALPIPDECPRLTMVWSPGLPGPDAPELRRGVVVALWDSGAVLRADSLDRPSGHFTVGEGRPDEAKALIEEVKDSPYWRRPFSLGVDLPTYELILRRDRDRLRHPVDHITADLEVIRHRIFSLVVSRPHRSLGPIDPGRWRCPAFAAR